MQKKRLQTILRWITTTLLALVVIWLVMGAGCLKFRTSDKDALRAFEEVNVPLSLRTMKLGDRLVHYAVTGMGDKPTILFLHGSPGSWNAFESYLKDKDLLSKYRMVSIDRPGFGYSDYGDATGVVEQAELLGPLLDTLQNQRPFYVAGHSLGGPLAVLLAAKYPEQVDGLILLAASVDPNEEAPEKWRPFLKAFPFRYFLPGAFRPSNIELWAFKKDVLTMPDALQRITCPVVIIQGEKDPLVPPGNAYYAQKHLTRAASVEMIMIDSANHFIPWMNYDVIKMALLKLQPDALRK